MQIIADNLEFAKRYFDFESTQIKDKFPVFFPNENQLYSLNIFENDDSIYWDEIYVVKVAEKSQYDTLINLAQNKSLAKPVLCIAGTGKKFHGFKNRRWSSYIGNIHLSASFKPNCEIENFGIGFLILSAVSVVMTLDEIPELQGKSMIKWVNDIMIDNKKVCGVLAHTTTQGNKVRDAIIGIGLNVNITPDFKTDKFVKEASSINDFVNTNVSEKWVFHTLIKHLKNNYNVLVNGGYYRLLQFYKDRSLIIDKNVSVWSDTINPEDSRLIAQGMVERIGRTLELYIENYENPIINGRLSLE